MDNLWVNSRLTDKNQLIPRRYTLTHSDETGEIFLIIDSEYADYKLAEDRQEVLGEWRTTDNCHYFFLGNVHVDSDENSFEHAKKRYDIFNRELPLALKAIKAGDESFFSCYPQLEAAPIFIRFHSEYPELNQTLYFKTFAAYS